MNNLKLKILIIAFLAILIADLTQMYVSEEFERPILYRFKVLFIKIGAFLARLGAFFNFANDVFLFRNYLNFGSNLINLLPKDNSVTIKDTVINGINVRIYKPVKLDKNEQFQFNPFLIYYHGGYYIFGNLNSYDIYLIELSKRTNLVIISVDYNLAPENPFPGPLLDCIKVTEFIVDNSEIMNLDIARYILGGDSAGGHAAAAISQYLLKMKKPKPLIQLLIYPWTQMYTFSNPSFIYYNQKDFIANSKIPIGRYMLWLLGIKDNITEEMENVFSSDNHTLLLSDKNLRKRYESNLDIGLVPAKYKAGKVYYDANISKNVNLNKLDASNILFKNKELANKIKILFTDQANPGLVSDELLKRLPKAYFLIVEWDSLKDQGLIYAERLKSNGVSVKIAYYENAYHGMVPFIHPASGYNLARTMFEDVVNFINLNV